MDADDNYGIANSTGPHLAVLCPLWLPRVKWMQYPCHNSGIWWHHHDRRPSVQYRTDCSDAVIDWHCRLIWLKLSHFQLICARSKMMHIHKLCYTIFSFFLFHFFLCPKPSDDYILWCMLYLWWWWTWMLTTNSLLYVVYYVDE